MKTSDTKKETIEKIRESIRKYSKTILNLRDNPTAVIGEEFSNDISYRNGLEDNFANIKGTEEYEELSEELKNADDILKNLFKTKDEKLLGLLVSLHRGVIIDAYKGKAGNWWWYPERTNPVIRRLIANSMESERRRFSRWISEYNKFVLELEKRTEEFIPPELEEMLFFRDLIEDEMPMIKAIENLSKDENLLVEIDKSDKILKNLFKTNDQKKLTIIAKLFSFLDKKGREGWWHYPEKTNPAIKKVMNEFDEENGISLKIALELLGIVRKIKFKEKRVGELGITFMENYLERVSKILDISGKQAGAKRKKKLSYNESTASEKEVQNVFEYLKSRLGEIGTISDFKVRDIFKKSLSDQLVEQIEKARELIDAEDEGVEKELGVDRDFKYLIRDYISERSVTNKLIVLSDIAALEAWWIYYDTKLSAFVILFLINEINNITM